MYLKKVVVKKWHFHAPCNEDGTCDLLVFLSKIPNNYRKDRDKLLALLDSIASKAEGPQLLPRELSHIIDKKHKIYQFRAGKIRLMYFYSEGQRKIIICSNCFVKKTRKTPKKEIKKAVDIKTLYENSEQNVIID